MEALPTIAVEDIPGEGTECPSPEMLRRMEAEERMHVQRHNQTRWGRLQHAGGAPIVIHHGPRPTGKQIRSARKAAKEAHKHAKPVIE